MRKRLRKKLHIGEYAEFGFVIKALIITKITEELLLEFLDDLILFVEEHDMCLCGSANKHGQCEFIISSYERSLRHKDQYLIVKWFREKESIRDIYVTDFIDMWYGDFDNLEFFRRS